MNHANANGYFVDLATCFHSNAIYYRRIAGGIEDSWVRLLDSNNYMSIIKTTGDASSYISCVKRITSGSKVTITIPRNNLSYSTALLDDVSIKCYLSGYAENYVDIYNNEPTTVAARWGNSSLNSYYPTIGCSYSSTTATITLTATFSTTRFLVIRYCPGLTTITVS